jgi:tetratricopeptide (TPR) repeat protein
MRKSLSLLFCGIMASSILALPPARAQEPVPSASPTVPSFESALHLYRTEQFDQALDQYNSLIAAGSQPALAYAGLARVFLSLKRIDDAHTAAAKAVELVPDLPDAHVALGEVYFRQGKLADAENEFIALVQGRTSNARAYLGMARISEAASFHKQANDMIEKAFALDPDDRDIVFQRFRILGRLGTLRLRQEGPPPDSSDPSPPQSQSDVPLTIVTGAGIRGGPNCSVVSTTKSAQMNLLPLFETAKEIGGFGLLVKLDGASSKLQLDTGASGLLVNSKIAEKAKLRKLGQTTINGIGDKGPTDGYFGIADSIIVGDIEFKGCLVEVSDKKSILGQDGLIGSDVFAHFLVDIDFPNKKFRLSELPPYPDPQTPQSVQNSSSQPNAQLHNRYVAPEMKTYTPVYQFGHDLLVKTQINTSSTKLFIIDTGSTLNLISPAAAKEVTKVSRDSQIEVKGLSGNVKNVFSADQVTLTFGNLRQRNLGITSFDTTHISDSLGTEVSGFLGFEVLRMLDIKIDYRDGLVKFEFDANRFH